MSGSVIKRNIVANTIGGVWILGLGFFLVPAQFKILGPEVVGLLGFIATLQLIFAVFDFGLSPTILREIASDSSPNREISRDLIQSAAMVYWVVAAVLGISIGLAAGWFSRNWITLENLTSEYATVTIRLLAFRLFISWPLALYVNILAGLQRLEVVNALQMFATTLSIGGGIIILLIWGDLHSFLVWTIAVSTLSIVIHILACYRYFTGVSLFPKFSRASFTRIRRFALDMNLISVLSVLFTQADSMLVSYLLPLKMLGFYNGAYSINKRGVGSFQSFFTGAMLPSLAEDFSHNRMDLLKLRFNKYSQVLVYLSALPTFVFIFWGYDVLRIWTTLEVAEGAHTALAILSLGFLLNSAMSTCYILSVATGHTRIPLMINLVGIGIYLPGAYVLIVNWGINGAALAWVLLNIYYVFTLLPLTQTRILQANPTTWMVKNLLPFGLWASISFGLGRTIIELATLDGELVIWGICAICTVSYGIGGFFFLDRKIRQDILLIVTRMIKTGRLSLQAK